MSVLRWVLTDPLDTNANTNTYTFPRNPSEMTSVFAPQSIDEHTSGRGTQILIAGDLTPQTWTFSGTFLHKSEIDTLHGWIYRRKRYVYLTDHFGRKITLVFQGMEATPKQRSGYYWSHDYTVTALVLAVGGPTITDAGPQSAADLDPVLGVNSGVYMPGNSATLASRFATYRGRALGNMSVFPTRDQGTAGLADTSFIPPAATADSLAVAMPMTLTDLTDDLTAPATTLANAFKTDGRPVYLRLGWEMNLPEWPWAVTDNPATTSNLTQWRARWSQLYDLFKTILGDQVQIGLNPNIGPAQTDLTGDWLDKIWVTGKVDWVGVDAYDCYPPYTSAANIAEQLDRDYGLRWWSLQARARGVPLALPEWAVASGTQWAGNEGLDNPTYIQTIHDFIAEHIAAGGTFLFESYFHETASYLLSDFTSNPNAGAKYKALFG